jgi:hypothetical protein
MRYTQRGAPPSPKGSYAVTRKSKPEKRYSETDMTTLLGKAHEGITMSRTDSRANQTRSEEAT